MPTRLREIMQTFPPRPLAPFEHALLAEWLELAGDIASAHVSDRRSDDPALYRRIAIFTRPDSKPSHLIHAPADMPYWLVFSTGADPRIQEFDTLRAALNSIRPVLP
jgi:hypothetical protein